MCGMCKGQLEDHVQQSHKYLDLKNVTGNIGLFRLPRGEDVVRVRPKVSQEMFQLFARSVM
jgi:hypothetical protein